MIPAPAALRLVSAVAGPPPAIPFGLASWADDAAAIAVVLNLSGAVPIAEACAQIPSSATLDAGTLVVVLGECPAAPSLLGRLLGSRARKARVSRAVRGTALLALGFVEIAAGIDPASGLDLVWGYAATRSAIRRD